MMHRNNSNIVALFLAFSCLCNPVHVRSAWILKPQLLQVSRDNSNKRSLSSSLTTTISSSRPQRTIVLATATTTTSGRRKASSLHLSTVDEDSIDLSSPPSGSGALTLDGKEIRKEITLLSNFILVKVEDTLTSTSGGVLLPDQSKQRPTEGLVIESGPGKIHPFTAVRITNPIKPGLSVLYGMFDGRKVEYNGIECQMIRDDDVLLYYTGITMKIDTVTPVRDYVLIKIDDNYGDQPLKTSSGVVIASQVMKDTVPCEGTVVKIGEGRMASDGKLTKSPVQPGDVVKYKDYAGNDVIIEGKSYSVVKMVDILCTMSTTTTKSTSDDETTTAS